MESRLSHKKSETGHGSEKGWHGDIVGDMDWTWAWRHCKDMRWRRSVASNFAGNYNSAVLHPSFIFAILTLAFNVKVHVNIEPGEANNTAE